MAILIMNIRFCSVEKVVLQKDTYFTDLLNLWLNIHEKIQQMVSTQPIDFTKFSFAPFCSYHLIFDADLQ